MHDLECLKIKELREKTLSVYLSVSLCFSLCVSISFSDRHVNNLWGIIDKLDWSKS